MSWIARGQYCMYCTSYLPSGNLSRLLDTCVRFDGRFSTGKSKESLDLEQKHKASYTKKNTLAGRKVKEMLGEFVGHKFTLSMGEMILKKAGHRMVNFADGEINISPSSFRKTSIETFTQMMGINMTAAARCDPDLRSLQESKDDSRKEEQFPDCVLMSMVKRVLVKGYWITWITRLR